jgi:hypothetical protein
MELGEGKSLKISRGVTLKINVRFTAFGEIVNAGNFVIGMWPERDRNGFVRGAWFLNKGRFENKKDALVECHTASHFENYGTYENAGRTHLGCNVELKTGMFTSTRFVELRQGTPRGDGYSDRHVDDGKLRNQRPVKIVNTGDILQRADTSVSHWGVFENFGSYRMVGGTFHNGNAFQNICKGKAEGLPTGGNAAETKPCDTDGDGIPDPSDQCPNDKEVVNGIEDKDGCPEATGSGGPQ